MKTSFFRSAAIYGVIISLGLIILSLLDWTLGFYGQKSAFSLLTWVVIIGGLIWAAINYRQKELGGYMSYGQAYYFSITVAAVYSLISTLFTLLLTRVIDPGYMTKVLEFTEEKLYEAGMSASQVDAVLEMSRNMSSPLISFISGFFSFLIISAIIALVTSAFAMRKNPNPFIGQEN